MVVFGEPEAETPVGFDRVRCAVVDVIVAIYFVVVAGFEAAVVVVAIVVAIVIVAGVVVVIVIEMLALVRLVPVHFGYKWL